MNEFKVGDVAIGCNMKINVDRNGMECVIIEPLEWRTGIDGIGRVETHMQYFVTWADGKSSNVAHRYLRKKRPPSSDEAAHRQAMLDCIERAKRPVEVQA